MAETADRNAVGFEKRNRLIFEPVRHQLTGSAAHQDEEKGRKERQQQEHNAQRGLGRPGLDCIRRRDSKMLEQ